MGKRDQTINDKVEAVLHLLRKQAPLTLKQEKLCNSGCVERFLKCKGYSVKKATKQLRAFLSWRDSIGIETLMADEFSAELADGVAYVAGHDEESRPVIIFRIKQDYQKIHSHKLFIRLVVFTVEVAISTMPKNVSEFVILFDASFFRSASSFMNLLLAILKLVAEFYPCRLHRAFVIDPPSLFSYLWKGVRPFLELSTVTSVVSSLDLEDPREYDDFGCYRRPASLRYDASSISSTPKIGACSSSRFAFSVSHNFDTLKPWYLSLNHNSGSKLGHATFSSLGPALISPLNARSFSFASPAARSEPRYGGPRKSLFPSTPMPRKTTDREPIKIAHPRTPRPSFFQSPAVFFRKDSQMISKSERSRESFAPFLKFYRRPYDEMMYRSKMRPPLGGLISIVSPHVRRRHVSVSQRF